MGLNILSVAYPFTPVGPDAVGGSEQILTLLDREAPNGLVLDIRGNPGGDIEAAERILQMLTPAIIEPEKFHLANTKTIVRVLRGIRSMLRRKKLAKADAANDGVAATGEGPDMFEAAGVAAE